MILKTILHNRIVKEYADGKGVNELEGQRLAYLASQVPQNGVIVEIGSYRGQSAAYLASGAPQHATVYMVDMWDRNNLEAVSESNRYAVAGEKHLEIAIERLSALGLIDKITTIRGLSAEVAKGWSQKIDLLFIDGDHSYEGVKLDYENWYPFVKNGGVIAFHDYSNRWEGVQKFIEETASKELKYLGLHARIWSGEK
jgi:predicted O-methyltransferase YrrM